MPRKLFWLFFPGLVEAVSTSTQATGLKTALHTARPSHLGSTSRCERRSVFRYQLHCGHWTERWGYDPSNECFSSQVAPSWLLCPSPTPTTIIPFVDLIGFGCKNIKGTFSKLLISQVRHFEMRCILTNHALHPGLGQIGSPSPLNFRAAGPIAAPGNSLWLASASWQSAAQSLNDRTSWVFYATNETQARIGQAAVL
jgi:hypothetical protein